MNLKHFFNRDRTRIYKFLICPFEKYLPFFFCKMFQRRALSVFARCTKPDLARYMNIQLLFSFKMRRQDCQWKLQLTCAGTCSTTAPFKVQWRHSCVSFQCHLDGYALQCMTITCLGAASFNKVREEMLPGQFTSCHTLCMVPTDPMKANCGTNK